MRLWERQLRHLLFFDAFTRTEFIALRIQAASMMTVERVELRCGKGVLPMSRVAASMLVAVLAVTCQSVAGPPGGVFWGNVTIATGVKRTRSMQA